MSAVVLGIDPGHGGQKPGVVARGFIEKHFTLSVGLWLLQKTAALSPMITRRGDANVSLASRGAILRPCTHVISIHADSNASPQPHGMWIIHNKEAQEFAKELHKLLPQCQNSSLKTPKLAEAGHPLTGRAFNVLNFHENKPAILIECGFVSNREDAKYLKSQPGQEQIATDIANALSVVLGVPL